MFDKDAQIVDVDMVDAMGGKMSEVVLDLLLKLLVLGEGVLE